MPQKTFPCPKCGTDVPVEGKQISISCPGCGKLAVVPPALRQKSRAPRIAVALTIVFLAAIAGGLVFMTLQNREKAAIEQAQRVKAEQARREQEQKELAEQRKIAELAAWKKTLELLKRDFHSIADIEKSKEGIKAFGEKYPDSEMALQIPEALKKLDAIKKRRVGEVMSKLEWATQDFLQNAEFAKAASTYRNYSGDFADATRELRDAAAKKLDVKAAEAGDVAKKALELENRKREFLNSVAENIIAGRISSAAKNLAESEHKDEFPELVQIFEDILNAQSHIAEGIAAEAGKELVLNIRDRHTGTYAQVKGKILSVEEGIINIEQQKDNMTLATKIRISDLTPEEKLSRMGSMGESARAVFTGLYALNKSDYKTAGLNFTKAGALSEPLLAKLRVIEEKAAAEKAARIAAKAEENEEEQVNVEEIEFDKLDVDVHIGRGARKHDATSYGSKHETLLVTVTAKNLTGVKLPAGKVVFYLIGEGLKYKRTYQVIETWSIDLKDLENREERKFDERHTSVYDDAIIKYGHKYFSWLYVVLNEKGEISKAKAKHSRFENNAGKIMKMEEKSQFDRDANVLEIDPGDPY